MCVCVCVCKDLGSGILRKICRAGEVCSAGIQGKYKGKIGQGEKEGKREDEDLPFQATEEGLCVCACARKCDMCLILFFFFWDFLSLENCFSVDVDEQVRSKSLPNKFCSSTDFMEPTLQSVISYLDLIFPLIQQVDPELFDFLQRYVL